MLDTTKKLAALLAAVAITTSCSEDDSDVNRKAPEILEFYAQPQTAVAGEFVLIGWVTNNADRVSLLERQGEEGDYTYDPLYENEQVLSGFLQYRAQTDVDIVLRAHNTNSSAAPAEEAISVTVEAPAGSHVQAFWPEPAFVKRDEPVTLKYILEDVQAGWSIELERINSDLAALSRTFTEADDFVNGQFEAAECTADEILCIEGHTGYNLRLLDAEGEELEYRETSVGLSSEPLPQVVTFAFDDEQITTGDSTTLRWEVHNADSIEISPGIGTSICNDGVCEGSEVVAPTFTQDFELTAVGSGGTMVAQRTITVLESPTPPTVVSFAASPSEIRPGTAATLSWDTELADSVDITAIPADPSLPVSFSVDGSTDVTPDATTTYTITATNTHGDDTDTATVTVTPLDTGDLVISEIMIDALTDPAGEWFEIHNPGSMPVNLDGLTITSTGGETDTVDADVFIDAGGYVVLAASSDGAENDNLPATDWIYSGLTLDTGSDDSLAISDGATTIDDVTWDASWTTDNGHSLSLTSLDATDNDDVANWCSAGTMWTGATGSYGSPGDPHDTCAP
jgi:hypothetical protein